MQTAFVLSSMFPPTPSLRATRPSYRPCTSPASSRSTPWACDSSLPPAISVSSTPLPRAVLSAAAIMATALTPLPHPLAVGTPVHRARLAVAIARRHLPAATSTAAAAAAATAAAKAVATSATVAPDGSPSPPPSPLFFPAPDPPTLLVASINGTVVGGGEVGLVRLGGVPVAMIGNVGVGRRWRRRGVGGALMVAAAGVAARWGEAAAYLVVEEANTGAIACYSAGGWSVVGTRGRGVVMRKSVRDVDDGGWGEGGGGGGGAEWDGVGGGGAGWGMDEVGGEGGEAVGLPAAVRAADLGDDVYSWSVFGPPRDRGGA